MRGVAAIGLAGALAVLVVACSSAEAPPPPKGDDCEVTRAAASHMLAAVVGDNQKCETDADCVTVPVSASCFDGCTASVNQTGKGALDRALTPVEAGPCKAFSNAGCTKVIPPCAPPSPPVCRAGLCQ